ncbi:diphthine--ammonia ligase [archaeon]|jgi:diphthine-ammonia ligase|nr:diphthine--ammonia ligase [archaeon]MBT6762754.1 diphthine--ammonia ligase [archaeon]
MCGITAIFNFKEPTAKAAQALKVMQNRGQDYYGIYNGTTLQTTKDLSQLDTKDSTNFALGHCLHAIVGTVPQPLINKEQNSQLIANCEIYNWQELNKKHGFNAANDAELLHSFLDKFKTKNLNELDGVFAFVYKQNNQITIARDILGIKPIHYAINSEGLAVASEQKALKELNFIDIHELNPRIILTYNQETNTLKETKRPFFKIEPEHQESKEEIQTQTQFLLDNAIKKRTTNKKIALLFSGGIDSTYIAHELKRQGIDFTCYTAAINDPNSPVEPEDLVWAKRVAKELDLKLVIKQININKIPEILNHLVPLIEDSNVVKVSVALTFYLASQAAKEDNCRVIFSGLGSEEIFAGYQRHKDSQNINKECLAGLRKIYERDLYRDDVLTMDNLLELRIPFLDHKLVNYALKIPELMKLVATESEEIRTKDILRQIALKKGIPTDISMRKKRAAQYGSRTQQALKKLSKKDNHKSISNFLHQFYKEANLKLGVLFSGGKDSTRAAEIMHNQNYQLSCLIYLKSKNDYSYMFQSAGSEIIDLQSEAMQIPLITQLTEGKKETELEDLKVAIQTAKDQHQIEGIVCGALFSNYQRDRIEKICEELNLKMFAPLWHKSQLQHMNEVINSGTEAIITAVAADGLNQSFLGRTINQNLLTELQQLNKKVGLNIAGEGGEFESLVLNSPLFHQRIILQETTNEMDSEYSGKLLIKKAKLKEK